MSDQWEKERVPGGREAQESGVMEINLPNLVKTLGEHLYSDPDVAIRELIQNAHDACEVHRATGAAVGPLRVVVESDPETLLLTVTDNGAGLTHSEVKEFLNVVGSSRTDEVREKLLELGRKSEADHLIGRFGLGLLSAFTIGHRVEFVTRAHAPGADALRWWCDGGTEWNMTMVDDAEIPGGTSVIVHVDPQHVGLLNSEYLAGAVRRYAEFLDIEVYLGSELVNSGEPPWAVDAPEADHRAFLQRRYPHEEILAVIPVSIEDEEDGISVMGALFIPDAPSLLVEEYGDVAIYCHRYFVCDDNRTLLPKWARFVRGVIDSPDLKEMTDRERVVEDAAFERIRDLLGARILEYFDEVAAGQPHVLDEIVRRQNITIKAWALASDELFDCVRDRVLFKVGGQTQSLATYLRERESQEPGPPRRIFCRSKAGAASQFVVLARARGIPVIDAYSFPDLHFVEKYARKEADIEVVDLDQSGTGLFDPVVDPPKRWGTIEDYFQKHAVTARLCYFDPGRIPAILTREDPGDLNLADLDELLGAPDLDQVIKRYLRATRDRMNFDQEHREASGEELYMNARSPIVKALLDVELFGDDLGDVLDALYNNALLLSWDEKAPPEILEKVLDGQTRVIATLLARAAAEATDLPGEPDEPEAERVERDARHVTCFVAIPFDPAYDEVQEALEAVLCGPPFFFEVSRASRKYFSRTVENNVESWIKRADCFAVDISGFNPNVMMELGLIYWHYRERPLLLLCDKDQDGIADLEGMIRIQYPVDGSRSREDIEAFFRSEVNKMPQLLQFGDRKHFLSPVALAGLTWLAPEVKEAIAGAFETIEDLLAAPPEAVSEAVGEELPPETISRVRKTVADVAGLPST